MLKRGFEIFVIVVWCFNLWGYLENNYIIVFFVIVVLFGILEVWYWVCIKCCVVLMILNLNVKIKEFDVMFCSRVNFN